MNRSGKVTSIITAVKHFGNSRAQSEYIAQSLCPYATSVTLSLARILSHEIKIIQVSYMKSHFQKVHSRSLLASTAMGSHLLPLQR